MSEPWYKSATATASTETNGDSQDSQQDDEEDYDVEQNFDFLTRISDDDLGWALRITYPTLHICLLVTPLLYGHYPGHFGEFSGFSKMNFYTTTHSITTNVIDLERTRQAASNGTPMSTLKMKFQ